MWSLSSLHPPHPQMASPAYALEPVLVRRDVYFPSLTLISNLPHMVSAFAFKLGFGCIIDASLMAWKEIVVRCISSPMVGVILCPFTFGTDFCLFGGSPGNSLLTSRD